MARGHDHDQQPPGERRGNLARHAAHLQPLLQVADQERRDDRPQDRTAAAVDRGSAEYHCGDRGQERGAAEVDPRRAEVCREHEAGEGRSQARQDVGGRLDTADGETRVARGGVILADEEHHAPEARGMEQEDACDRADKEDRERQWQAEDSGVAETREGLGEPADALVSAGADEAGQDGGRAGEEVEAAKRDDQRLQSAECDDRGIEGAGERARRQRSCDGQRERGAEEVGDSEDDRREADRRGEAHVDPAGDDDEGQGTATIPICTKSAVP